MSHTGGCEAGLLHLFTAWREGAVILAGAGLAPANPAPTGPRVARDCAEARCQTTVFGESDIEAADRLAEHRRRCHG